MSTQANYNVQDLRTKYLKMARSKGVSATISALHREINKLEIHTFDGGYENERLKAVEELRELSRQIWSEQFLE